MANNPVVNSLTFTGSVAGQASIQSQGIAGGLTFLLPNTAPTQGQLLDVSAINGNNVFLGWVSPQSGSGAITSVFGRTGVVVAASNDYNFNQLAGSLAVTQINSKRGTGTFVQLAVSGTAGAAGDVVTFDANGNTVDSGVLLSALARAAANLSSAPAGNVLAGDGAGAVENSGISINDLCLVMGATGVQATFPDAHTASGVITINGVTPVTITLSGNATFGGASTYVVQTSYKALHTTMGILAVANVSGSSFTIVSTDSGDTTSTVAWTAVGLA